MLKKYNLFFLLFLVISSTSCKKFLDQVPDDVLTTDDIFQSKTYVDQYLAQIYANIPNELGQRFVQTMDAGPWIAGSDEGMYNWDFNYANYLNNSTWSTTDDEVSSFWSNYYKSIRNAGDFISKIDNANSGEVTTATKKSYKGEARALRAMYYYWLVRMYGPVPLITDVIPADASLEDILKSRNTMDECVSYISTELDSAYDDLKTTPLNGEYGRITKGIVKAFKEKALLLNASPLFNGNSDMASLKNSDGSQLINQTYDAGKWKLAADAAKAFIDEFVGSGVYDLYTESGSDSFMTAYLSCRDVITTPWNKEWIFARNMGSDANDYSKYDKTPKHVGFTSNVQGGGALGATQTIVDAYFMNNGLPITDANSGYVNSGFSNFKAPFDVEERSTYNQWVNREARFYVGITYNNSYFLFQGGNTDEVITQMNYSGNSGRSQSTSDVSPTGYIIRKGINTSGSTLQANVQLRVAEIYLDYAEALNEYDPGNSDILKYLNLIRIRAGIPAYGSATINAPTSQSEMRNAIRKERQIELAFESVRYFDCHRWKTSKTSDNLPVYGMNLTASGDFYTSTLIKNRVFQQRDYLWPIPNNEILKDNLLVQNPGW